MTSYKLNRFTMADAQLLAGKTADITEWGRRAGDQGHLPRRKDRRHHRPHRPVPGHRDRRRRANRRPDRRTAGHRPPAAELHLGFTWVCEVDGVRDRFQRGDWVALEHTDAPDTRLRPGDEGTVTRYDPGPGQLDVRWDSGSTLAMLLNDGDRVRLIIPAPGAGTGENEKETGR